mmetsp:Transcript_16532/g.34920  ORF Transcript_16532/g.34920 Transcript_16532/m.34920 type:complete len:1375 (-) Transcript_16532:78-4202(-)
MSGINPNSQQSESESVPPAPGGSNTTTYTSIHSVQSTRITQSGNSISVHSSHSIEVISTDDDEEIMAIQTSIEQVADSQNSPQTTRTRAGFNSISDALGNLRTRLQQAHQAHQQRASARRSSNNPRGSMLQRLQDRLHVVDAAHSSRVPLRVMESRRASVPNRMIDQAGENAGSNEGERPSSAASAPPLHASAAIFRIDTRETAHYEDAATDGSTSRQTLQTRRSSVLFASRITANRSIMEGSSNVLLASGGDGSQTSRSDLLGVNSLRSRGDSLRDFELHVHPSISRRMLSPIADSNHSHGSETSATASDEEDTMETEPTTNDGVFDTNNKLYSWGSGMQSMHDDSNERSQDKNNSQHLQVVSSRLESKSILHASCGAHHSACATSRGTLYVAGKNVRGCVDPNSSEGEVISRPMLLDCVSHVRVMQVSCGFDHTAVLSSNGSVLTWGSNQHGQLGHRINGNQKIESTDYQGPIKCRPSGMALGKGRKASSIACGTNYTMILTQHMSVLVCGISSITGNHDVSKWGTPVEIPSLMGLPLVGISAGDGHAAVVTAHGTAFVWGENRNGCCARDFPKMLTLPVPVKAPSPSSQSGSGGRSMVSDDIAIVHVACGLEHTILVTRSGDLLVCGSNYRGQLGIESSKLQSTSKIVSVKHPKGGKFVSAEAGNGHSLALDASGNLWETGADGLTCIIEGKTVLVIAAGGDGNCIAIASPLTGSKSLQRQFSTEIPDDTKSIVDAVDSLLVEMESNENSQQHAGQEIAKKSEELLQHPSVLNLILNPLKLETMFERILRAGDIATRQTIANAIERGLKLGLESLRGSRMIYPEAVRCLLSYIKFFSIRDEKIVFDKRGEAIFLFCDTILGIPFEGYRALHDYATNLYPRNLFVKMLVRPLLLTLNACTKFTTDENQVQHFEPSRQAVPVIVAVLSWLHAMAEEANLADPSDFYSDGVSEIDVESLFEDLYRMKKASSHEKSKHFFLTAHPFLLSPGCKRNLLQMESQVEMFKTMMRDADFSASTNELKVQPFYHLEIEREHLVEQTLENIRKADPKELRKRLRVSFKGEEGLDAGGVTKEFFQLLCEELFDVHSGLWSSKYGDDLNWFNSENTWDDKGYELIGVLFGLALYNSVLLDVRFPLAVYRKILGLPLGLEDIIDDELRKGLKQLLDYPGDDVEDIFCLTFELTWMELGEERRLELKPDGANIPVTNENREEYVLRYVSWVLVDSINPQWDSFQTGLMRVMEDSSLDLFRPEELELLVVGTPELDFAALEANTKYEGGYDRDSEVVKNFWKFVKDAPHDTQIKLLKFAAATTKAPIGGLGKMDFIIQRAGPDSSNLPTSHTCFNTLLLPDYGPDLEKLESLLGRAILECEGFGLE